MNRLKYIISLLTVTMLSSCSLVDLGLAYIGYSIGIVIAIAVFFFLFSILYGLTKSQGWSIVLTIVMAFLIASYVFKW